MKVMKFFPILYKCRLHKPYPLYNNSIFYHYRYTD